MSVGSVLITGANRGLGLEFVKQFVSQPKPPSYIFASCRNPSKAEDLLKIADSNSNVKVIKLDMKDQESFPALRDQLERDVGESGLNLLINNAGLALRDSIDVVTKQNMIENFEINAVSPLLLTKELLPLLKKAAAKEKGDNLSFTRAGVVNITSKMGSIDDNTSGNVYPYRASKAALNMITKSLAVDLESYGILVVALHPGWVQTEMGGKGALITTQTSVNGMMNLIVNATKKHSGFMFAYDGKKIPW